MIWLGVRDIVFSPIGRHQFILVQASNLPRTQLGNEQRIWRAAIGGGRIGFTLAATNRDGRLRTRINDRNDLAAARHILRGSRVTGPVSHPALREIGYTGSETSFLANLLRLAANYSINERQQNIRYPWLGWGVNSNSWTRQLVRMAGGSVNPDMPGFDAHVYKHIPSIYFQAVCPKDPRPVVNP